MWIYMNDSFLSIVQHEKNPDILLVRARRKNDIKRVFPGHPIYKSERKDYRFRTFVNKRDVARVIAKRILNIDYPNFKGSVNELARHDVYSSVWATTLRLGQRRARRNTDYEDLFANGWALPNDDLDAMDRGPNDGIRYDEIEDNPRGDIN